MEITYTMIGGDGAQYGPASFEQIKGWIGEGRVTAQTKIKRSDTNSWLPALQYTELGLQPPVPAPGAVAQAPSAATMSIAILERRVKVSANWFYWIAALSLVNTFIALSGKGIQFVVGLAVTQKMDGLAASLGGPGSMTALALDIIVAGIFALFGFFAGRRHNWSFILGMILYALDAVLCLMFQSYLGLGFHAFVLFCIFKGLQANNQLNRASR